MQEFTQEWVDSLPHMTYKEALKNRGAYFKVSVGCGKCGCPVRYSAKKRNAVECANCLKHFKNTDIVFEKKAPKENKKRLAPLTCGAVNSSIGYHNREAERRSKDLWFLPRVFGGMNTI